MIVKGVELMATADNKKVVREPITLPSRIHINEFRRLSTELTDIQFAGFKLYANGKEWMRETEWQELFNQYSNKE